MELEPTGNVFSPRVTENHAGQPVYLVEYEEDQWYKYDKEGQDFCFETWARKAKPLGCVFVVLRLYPDALFPRSDKTTPYVAKSVPVDQDNFNPVSVSVRFTASIDPDTWSRANDGAKLQLKAQARRDIAMHALSSNGCAYEIFTRVDNLPTVVERGRL
jgi:hypothetical protein